jgi:tryptophanase
VTTLYTEGMETTAEGSVVLEPEREGETHLLSDQKVKRFTVRKEVYSSIHLYLVRNFITECVNIFCNRNLVL